MYILQPKVGYVLIIFLASKSLVMAAIGWSKGFSALSSVVGGISSEARHLDCKSGENNKGHHRLIVRNFNATAKSDIIENIVLPTNYGRAFSISQ